MFLDQRSSVAAGAAVSGTTRKALPHEAIGALESIGKPW